MKNSAHPLSEHAYSVLKSLVRNGPRPSQEINPGVMDKFRREGLAVEVQLPSPYKTHKGGTCAHAKATDWAMLQINERTQK